MEKNKGWPPLINEIIFKSSALLIKTSHCLPRFRAILLFPPLALSLFSALSLSFPLCFAWRWGWGYPSQMEHSKVNGHKSKQFWMPDLRRMRLPMDEMIPASCCPSSPSLLPPLRLPCGFPSAVHCSLHYPFAVLFLAFSRCSYYFWDSHLISPCRALLSPCALWDLPPPPPHLVSSLFVVYN